MGNYRKANYRTRDGRRLSAEEFKKRRKREIIFHLTLMAAVLIAVITSSVFLIYKLKNRQEQVGSEEALSDASSKEATIIDTIIKDVEIEEDSAFMEKSSDAASFFDGYDAKIDSDTEYISSESVLSTYGILVNLDSGKVVASKDGDVRINPASMTKILTLLVAAEHIDNLEDTFVMTQEIGNYIYSHDCSAVGLKVGDVQTIQDLMYGTILPSGADAAMCLAEYIAGSQDEFVKLMNDKLDELGLSDTAHFTNCIGIYDENHYCTLLDMAMILKAAEENELCHEVLNARTYTTSPTSEHPEGITISNWFLRRIEDKETNGEVVGAKTGFVAQSGCCGASYQVSDSNVHYICVTADAWSSWRCIYDHVDIYQKYT